MKFELPLDWDEANVWHSGGHGVSRAEVEQAARNEHKIFSLPDSAPGEDRYLLRGVTDGGRGIVVVFAYPVFVRREWGVQELDMARPITAYDDPGKG
ncbi:hypothetical protein GCM10009678_58740 [Actinomadura kijaniata]|uniref:Uncharacterized DUF497 family protein n=1 Tax=Actinomadura namibiensis TaxID=182080 RepID=A0A7W3LMQ4_ACTNM|nr:DUF4258 domain-containing protein [Actinomadura namibiensis]MBA8950880.1 uncharacterized DUF497 family protein [Actinomadura namibiensis]